MARYIDADKLRALFDNDSKIDGVFYCAVWEGIDKPSDFQLVIDIQPTLDVVEVVRCSDCTHWENGRCWLLKDITVEVRDNDFCSYGERKKK